MISEEEFARLTRRALSHLSDLPRLATSPLIRLPAVDAQLHQQPGVDNTLAKAAVLRDLLVASILQLKPRNRHSLGFKPRSLSARSTIGRMPLPGWWRNICASYAKPCCV